jgi:hypothetical protein
MTAKLIGEMSCALSALATTINPEVLVQAMNNARPISAGG